MLFGLNLDIFGYCAERGQNRTVRLADKGGRFLSPRHFGTKHMRARRGESNRANDYDLMKRNALTEQPHASAVGACTIPAQQDVGRWSDNPAGLIDLLLRCGRSCNSISFLTGFPCTAHSRRACCPLRASSPSCAATTLLFLSQILSCVQIFFPPSRRCCCQSEEGGGQHASTLFVPSACNVFFEMMDAWDDRSTQVSSGLIDEKWDGLN